MCRTCDHNTRRWLISLDTAQLIHKLGPTTSNTDDIFDKHSLDRICSQDKKAPDTGKMSIRQELRSILRLCEFKAFLDSETEPISSSVKEEGLSHHLLVDFPVCQILLLFPDIDEATNGRISAAHVPSFKEVRRSK